MDLSFYPGKKSKVIGLMMASPEEFQTYAGALLDVPEGCQLITRIRSVQVGKNPADKRREILIGASPIGQPLALEGEDESSVKPLAAPPVPRALDIPQSVHDAGDADLEVIAARNGVKVTEQWRRRGRPLREADVARAMADKKTAGE